MSQTDNVEDGTEEFQRQPEKPDGVYQVPRKQWCAARVEDGKLRFETPNDGEWIEAEGVLGVYR